jgi:hypothetical protein
MLNSSANVKEWKINQVLKSKNIISEEDDGVLFLK